MSDLAEARRLALSLPEATEQPHFDMASFRVRGKIFVTVPPEGTRLHVFIDPLEVEGYVAQDPARIRASALGGPAQRAAGQPGGHPGRDPGRNHRGGLAPQGA